MSATLADIAKATGTSISTVSRVLTGAPAARRISEQTREAIKKAAQEMGYRPNLLARSLRTRKTHTVAVMVSDIANPWFGQLASFIEQSLSRVGYSIMVCNSCEDADLEQQYLHLLPQKGIDGLIAVPLATSREALLTPLPSDLPVVVVDRPIDGVTASVATDQEQAAQLVCTELGRLHVRKVALVCGPRHVFTHRHRADAIRQCFEVVVEHEGPAQLETGRSGWEKVRGRNIEAVVCTNNFLGMGVLEAMAEGEELPPVACFDGIPAMDLLPMPITCAMQDVRQLAESAVELLLKQIHGDASVSPVTVPAHVVHNRAFSKRI